MTISAVTAAKLSTWVGLNVRDFCVEGGGAARRHDDTYHCAHYVAHVLGLLQHGTTHVLLSVPAIASRCANFRRITVPGSGGWLDYPRATGLIYVTPVGQLHTTGSGPSCRCTGINGTRRHIGFYVDGQVWHYENDSSYEQVVTYPLGRSPGSSHFYNRYGQGCELWLSDFPPGCVVESYSNRLTTQADLALLR